VAGPLAGGEGTNLLHGNVAGGVPHSSVGGLDGRVGQFGHLLGVLSLRLEGQSASPTDRGTAANSWAPHLRKEVFPLPVVQLKLAVARDIQFWHQDVPALYVGALRESTPSFFASKPEFTQEALRYREEEGGTENGNLRGRSWSHGGELSIDI